MARKRINGGRGSDIQIAGFWNREGAIDGQVVKKVVTRDDNVFYILRLTSSSTEIIDKTGAPVEVAVGQHVGIGRSSATECLEALIGAPGVVYLTSKGEKSFEARNVKGKMEKRTYWDIEVEHDDAAEVPGEQQVLKSRHRDVDAKTPLPGESDDDIAF